MCLPPNWAVETDLPEPARGSGRTLAGKDGRSETRTLTLKERHKAALWKKARRGFSGYPIATVAFYGPNDKVATKISVGIVLSTERGQFLTLHRSKISCLGPKCKVKN